MSEAKSTSDMRAFLLDSMQDVRDGKIDATQGRAIADIAKQVNDSARLDLEYAEFTDDKAAEPMRIVNQSEEETSVPTLPARGMSDLVIKPAENIVMEYYDDKMTPKDIAVLVGSDIKTVTEIINRNK